MHSLVLIHWLALAGPAVSEPVTIQVQTHTMVQPAKVKASASGQTLAAESTHAMSAQLDANGKVQYHCDTASHQHDSDAAARTQNEEH